MRSLSLRLAAALLGAALGSSAAFAQSYDEDGYDAPPPRRVYRYEEGYDRPPPRRAAGLNCDAVQPGLTGLKPFSCPLPGPRPLGARCFCDTPIAPFTGPRTLVGRVVP